MENHQKWCLSPRNGPFSPWGKGSAEILLWGPYSLARDVNHEVNSDWSGDMIDLTLMELHGMFSRYFAISGHFYCSMVSHNILMTLRPKLHPDYTSHAGDIPRHQGWLTCTSCSWIDCQLTTKVLELPNWITLYRENALKFWIECLYMYI